MLENKKEDLNISGIYCFKNKINNKLYIGSSINIFSRKAEHLRVLKKNKHHSFHFQKSWNKYGENNFEFKIIKVCGKNSLIYQERFYIKKYKSNNRNFGYNIRDFENRMPNNIRKILSKSLRNSNKFKEARKNQWKNRTRVKLNQYDLNGKYLKTWNSIKECSEQLNIVIGTIYASCYKEDSSKCAKNFLFRKFNNSIDNIKPYINLKNNPYTKGIGIIRKEKRVFSKVLCFSKKDKKFLKEFLNCSEAARELKIDNSCISKCCRGKIYYYKDYIFEYKNGK